MARDSILETVRRVKNVPTKSTVKQKSSDTTQTALKPTQILSKSWTNSIAKTKEYQRLISMCLEKITSKRKRSRSSNRKWL